MCEEVKLSCRKWNIDIVSCIEICVFINRLRLYSMLNGEMIKYTYFLPKLKWNAQNIVNKQQQCIRWIYAYTKSFLQHARCFHTWHYNINLFTSRRDNSKIMLFSMFECVHMLLLLLLLLSTPFLLLIYTRSLSLRLTSVLFLTHFPCIVSNNIKAASEQILVSFCFHPRNTI